VPTALGQDIDVLNLVAHAGPVVKFVLFVLVSASVLSWTVIAWKVRALRLAGRANRAFLDRYYQSRSFDELQGCLDKHAGSPAARIFGAGMAELQRSPLSAHGQIPPGMVDNVARTLSRATAHEAAEMELRVGWLATVANASPFIGLFGTVWGIMSSFQGIAVRGDASLAVVAPGISEALIATAAGLAAAIPAVVAYNHFVAQVRRLALDMEGFAQDFLNIVQQHLLGGG
jgi:biopolymer transport protein TolQ